MPEIDLQPITDHPFRPRWRDKTLCAFERWPEEPPCDVPKGLHRHALQPPIEIEVWKPHPTSPGLLLLDYRRKVQDVLDELNAKLKAEGLEPDEHGFSNMTKYDDPKYMEEPRKYSQYSLPWPEYRRIAVFPVTGGSEGHYIHVIVLDVKNGYTSIGLAKTFRGWDHACRISAAAARLLQA